MNKYAQNKGKEILRKIEAEGWYAEGVQQSVEELTKWLNERETV